ncbi:MAG: tyrosine-type recombinase/integrase, partial [Pseudomonadota bacterium]
FELHQEREKLLQQPRPVKGGKDISAVLRFYMASEKYASLKPRTRKDYDGHLTYFADKLGELHPRNIERHHVIKWQAAWAKNATPHSANYRKRILRIVMEAAKDMGILTKQDENPCKGVSDIKYEKQEREPWPIECIQAFREAYNYGTRERTCFELCHGTGQRIGDVLKMQWGDVKDGSIALRQGKTSKRLLVPLTPHLRAALDATKRESLYILSKDMTKTDKPGPWAYRSAAQAMLKARRAVGAENYDLHSLRYSAASELVTAGASDELVSAVTGQSMAMVAHYTKQVRQIVRAKEAQKLRE